MSSGIPANTISPIRGQIWTLPGWFVIDLIVLFLSQSHQEPYWYNSNGISSPLPFTQLFTSCLVYVSGWMLSWHKRKISGISIFLPYICWIFWNDVSAISTCKLYFNPLHYYVLDSIHHPYIVYTQVEVEHMRNKIANYVCQTIAPKSGQIETNGIVLAVGVWFGASFLVCHAWIVLIRSYIKHSGLPFTYYCAMPYAAYIW